MSGFCVSSFRMYTGPLCSVLLTLSSIVCVGISLTTKHMTLNEDMGCMICLMKLCNKLIGFKCGPILAAVLFIVVLFTSQFNYNVEFWWDSNPGRRMATTNPLTYGIFIFLLTYLTSQLNLSPNSILKIILAKRTKLIINNCKNICLKYLPYATP